MSCLTCLPYGKIFDYWWESLRGNRYRLRFLLTKLIEVSAFRENIKHNSKINFPNPSSYFSSKQLINNVLENKKPAVVVPAYLKTDDEVEMLNTLVTSIKEQTIDGHLIIVDDASPIPIPTYSDTHCIRLNDNSGPATARNVGITKALSLDASFIAFTDSDCLPSRTWLQKLRESFLQSPNHHIISGNTLSYDNCWLGKYHEINGTLNGRRITTNNNLLYGPTCNLAITPEIATHLRFNEKFPLAAAEDIDLCYRALKLGWTIKFCSNAVIHHNFGYMKLSYFDAIKRFWKQFKRYAEGEKLLLAEHPDYYSVFIKTKEIPAKHYI